jgi:hypothetical protein
MIPRIASEETVGFVAIARLKIAERTMEEMTMTPSTSCEG